jgi:hypothetical protein
MRRWYDTLAALAVGRRDDPQDLGPGELDLGARKRGDLVLHQDLSLHLGRAERRSGPGGE